MTESRRVRTQAERDADGTALRAPYEVREAARFAYIDHEGYGRVEGFNAAADLAYAAGVEAGRKLAAEAIRKAGGAFPDIRRQCANLAEHGTVNDREPA